MIVNLKKKPGWVKVFGRKLDIRYDANLKDYGMFTGALDKIAVKSDRCWQSHLFHEILHAVLYYSGHTHELREKYEEALINALENGLKTLTFGGYIDEKKKRKRKKNR